MLASCPRSVKEQTSVYIWYDGFERVSKRRQSGNCDWHHVEAGAKVSSDAFASTTLAEVAVEAAASIRFCARRYSYVSHVWEDENGLLTKRFLSSTAIVTLPIAGT